MVPRFLYSRVDSKEALFLAVYEYGITRVPLPDRRFRETLTTMINRYLFAPSGS